MSREAKYEDAPGSPLHPDPDQELQGVSSEPISSDELDFLELNPEIDEPVADKPVQNKPLDKYQQRRFITYVEEQQLQIQRKLVQSSLNTEAYSSLSQALIDIGRLLEFIWLSIANISSPDFGQTQLILALAMLPLDAVVRLSVTQAEAPELLALLSQFDSRLSDIIDKRASGTEKVRMGSIAYQARALLEEEFTKLKIEGFQFQLAEVYQKVLERTAEF